MNKLKNIGIIAAVLLLIATLFRSTCTNDKDVAVDYGGIIEELNDVLTGQDTVTVIVEKIVKVYIRDTVVVEKTFEITTTNNIRDTVIVWLSDSITPQMRVFEGSQTGDSCTYNYTAGIRNNALGYLQISSECRGDVVNKTVTKYVSTKSRFGVKATLDIFGNYGAGAMYTNGNIYLGVNYNIPAKISTLEAGYFIYNKKTK